MMRTTNAKILEEALILFTEKCYIDTTMKDIAERVGIKAPSIYEYYSSKEELFFDVIDYCLKKHQELLKMVYDELEFSADKNGMFKVYKTAIYFMMTNDYNYKFILRYILFPPEQYKNIVKDKMQELMRHSSRRIVDIYHELTQKKIIASINQDEFVSWFNRMITGDLFQITVSDENIDDQVLLSNWELFWSGVQKLQS